MSVISGEFWALLATGAAGGLALGARCWQRRRQDAAARARIEAELADRESRFRFVAENSSDLVWTMDLASGRFTYLSPAIHRLRGYLPEEAMAEPALAAFTAESAERIKLALAVAVARWHAGEDTDPQCVAAVELRHKDGHRVAGEIVAILRGNESGPQSVLGIIRETADDKSAEATASRAYAPPAAADAGADSPLRFHWRSAYESGLAVLDREHRTLFENASDLLHTALERERDPARFMADVDRLLSNVQEHFRDEEVLLQRIAYPDLAAHARRHRELVLQATHLREEARAGRISIGDWIEFVANDVVVGHLIREDRKFFPLLALATADDGAVSDTAAA